MSKNHSKIYTKPPNGGYGNKQRDLDIGTAVLSGVKTAFTCTQALSINRSHTRGRRP